MSNELALYKGGIEEIFGEEKLNVWTSIDTSTMEGKIAVQKAFSVPDMKGDALRDVPMPVQDVLIHSVRLKSERGEVVDAYRTVLVSPDGQTVAFTSEGVLASLKRIMSIFGMPPWKPALLVKVKEVRTQRGFRTLNLEVIGQEKPK